MERMMPPPHPMIVITEQPKQRGMRFRYECEGRSAGSIPGETTHQDRKTWPSVQIINFSGEVAVRVSLVSKDSPPRPHPHSLVGKDCANGICTVRVSPETQMGATFSNLGIQCVKRKEVAEMLKQRKKMQVDPFKTFQISDPQAVDIDLNIVQLCFEAFISQNGKHLPLQPVISKPIYDKKATCSALLRICRVNRSFGSCKGGDEVFLLCDKVQKDDISICFSEEGTNWESYGEFAPTDVHRQVAIVFRTPPYRDQNIVEPAKVFFQLKRSSDGQTSEQKDFTYLALHHAQPQLRGPIERKRRVDERNEVTQNAIRDHIHSKVARAREVHSHDNRLGQWNQTLMNQQHPQMTNPQQKDVLDRFLARYEPQPMPFPSNNQQFRNTTMPPRFQLQPNWITAPRISQLPNPPPPHYTNSARSGLSTTMQLGPTSPQHVHNLEMQPNDGGAQQVEFSDINLDSLPSLSGDEIGLEMKQLSLEENISISDLIKPEPSPANILPFPNPTPLQSQNYPPPTPPSFILQAPSPQQQQPQNYPPPTPPSFILQAPSPQQQQPQNYPPPTPPSFTPQASSPSQYVSLDVDDGAAVASLLPSYDFPNNIPSFDINDPQLQYASESTQNDIEDIVKGATSN